VSAWRLALLRDGETAALVVDATIEAKEPAGAFTDIVAVREDGARMRARVAAEAALGSQIGSRVRLGARSEELHLFGGPFPGSRLG
jgi:hypothetical protein